eukprot:Sdes_comp13560_c0_seq1m3237
MLTSHLTRNYEEKETEKEGHSEEQQERNRFNVNIQKAKSAEEINDYEEALKWYQKSVEEFPEFAPVEKKEKLQKKVGKLQTILAKYVCLESGFTKDPFGNAVLDKKFSISFKLHEAMFPHQREGVKWLWNLHKRNFGGILGDDMGLGKTIQIVAFLAGLFSSRYDSTEIKKKPHITSALIVVPVSLLSNWSSELLRWAPEIPIQTFYGASKMERLGQLKRIQSGCGICLTTYGMVPTNIDLLNA